MSQRDLIPDQGERVECPHCEGTGDRFGRAYGPKIPCPQCGGSGNVASDEKGPKA